MSVFLNSKLVTQDHSPFDPAYAHPGANWPAFGDPFGRTPSDIRSLGTVAATIVIETFGLPEPWEDLSGAGVFEATMEEFAEELHPPIEEEHLKIFINSAHKVYKAQKANEFREAVV